MYQKVIVSTSVKCEVCVYSSVPGFRDVLCNLEIATFFENVGVSDRVDANQD